MVGTDTGALNVPHAEEAGEVQDDLWSDESEQIAGEYADPKSLGSQRLQAVSVSLTFPERNMARMTFATSMLFEVAKRTRLIQRQYRWSGRGVHGRPQVKAWIDDEELPAVLHGPIWTERKVNSYLIDLSRTVSPGTEVRVETHQDFVDEAEAFHPQLSLKNFHSYQMRLAVAFLEPPDFCVYEHLPIERLGTTDNVLNREEIFGQPDNHGLTQFTCDPDVVARGTHRLTW